MMRILFNFVLPLALPTAIYLGWTWFLRHRSKSRGDEIPEIKSAGLFISLLVGVVLMFAGLIYVAVISGAPPGDGLYQAPRLENGNITNPVFK